MSRKKKQEEGLPAGMTRRQAKLARRAAERAALEKDPRPFGGLACEADLVALQEFVPSATATVTITGQDKPVTLCTVLPGAVAAVVRSAQYGGDALVALQMQSHSQNPGRDLAFQLRWAGTAHPGETLTSGANDGTQPPLTDLIPADAELAIAVHDDFSWWIPEGGTTPPSLQQGLRAANESAVPSRRVTAAIPGAAWWVDPGNGKAHIRWVRAGRDASGADVEVQEDKVLAGLARVAARGELNLGEETRFAGAFRTHGLVVPVFDLDPNRPVESYADDLEALEGRLSEAIASAAESGQLTSEEHKQLQNIKSRQVTI